LAQEREHHEVWNVYLRSEALERMRSLHRQRHAYAERGQRHHRCSAHSDENHLPKNRRDLEKLPLKRRDENPIEDVEIEKEIIFHLPLERAECQGKRNEESAKFPIFCTTVASAVLNG